MFIMTLMTVNLEESDQEFALRIYKEYYSIIKYTILHIIDDKESTEDLIQECFISLLPKIELLRNLDLYKLNSYIVITTKRKTYDFNKKRKKKLLYECIAKSEDGTEIFDNISCNSQSIEAFIEIKDDCEKIVSLINKLPEKYRLVLLFKYQYDMSDIEIAHQMNIKPGSIRMYIKRAREKLIALLKKENLYEF